ncbi:putative retrotransposon hot spot (RHS) protein [Trypanosoma cruzi]|nr:putative retrotransposon hot spot (RHS) protein [Trypanosoma cruzi]
MWRCCGRLHVALLRGWRPLTVSPTGVAVRLHGAPTAPPCECHAQRHWDCGTKQPRVSFGASGTCWPQLGGASGMLHRTGVVMAPHSGISGDGSDAAARNAVGSKQRPQWTINSSIEDILLGGDTLSTDMKLNDFLRNYVGGRAAVDEDSNVTMQVFVRRPNAYVQDQRLLEEIFNLTEYQVYKLNHEGVFFLHQWREYERKDTITPLARGKLNAALTQIQREELKRAQEMKFTISTTVRDVLFRGRVRVNEMSLNDFLLLRFGGKGVADTNRSVLLKEFFNDPTSYIRDKGVLKEIQTTDAYARMEKAVREEMDLEEVVRKLSDKGVNNVLGWSRAAEEVKATVCENTKNSLDAALEELRKPTTTSAAMKLEGYYESVYNARWHHLVEIPDGDKRKKTGTGMEAKEGKPKQSWTYRKAGETFEKDDAVRKSGEAPPVLMVLTSDKGWPYSWNITRDLPKDFFINCEVERVWQIVLDDLTEWFSNFDLILNSSPVRRLLIGTPGIGKSVAAGSYLLYQLLHCDVEKIQVVVHCFGGRDAYVFDKTAKIVTRYSDEDMCISELRNLRERGMKGYIIYDVAKKGTPPLRHFAPTSGWGMIVVSSPKVTNYDEWAKQLQAARVIMNCPDEMDVKAMCAWMKRNETLEKQAEYWKEVEERMKNVGPIPRHIFDKKIYKERLGAVDGALEGIKPTDAEKYFTLGGEEKKWYSEDPSHKLVKVVRAKTDEGAEVFLNAPICDDIGFRTADRLAKVMSAKDFLLLILASRAALASKYLEQLGLRAFMYGEFVIELAEELKELRPSEREAQDSVLNLNHQGYPTRTVGLPQMDKVKKKINIEYGVLYIPKVENFPLVDGLFFVDSPRRTLVGLQMTTAGEHHTIPSTVRLFNERLAAYFEGWEELSRDMSWEIIYVQHENSTMITNWQRCGPVNTKKLSDDEKKIVAFWDRKVHEYQFVLTTDFVKKIRAK